MSLTEQQKKFIKFYIESGRPKESALKAGYAVKSASKSAHNLLKHSKEVMAALQEIRENKDKPKNEYDLKAAMAEADEAIAIAKATDNAASFLAAVKLKAQLMKILDDRPSGAQFQINISGIGGNDGEKTLINVIQVQPGVNLLTGDENE